MTDAKADELIAVLTRIADALEGPPVRQPVQAAEAPKGCAEGVHAEKHRVYFGPPGDSGGGEEWECAVPKGGCGYRTPALAGAGA